MQGPAFGAGFPLAMTADIVIAGESASFGTAYAGIGLTADAGITWILPRLVGLRKAQELLILNTMVKAVDALDMGLVTRVVLDAQLDEQVERIVQKILDGPVKANASVKALLVDTFKNGLEDQMEQELQRLVSAGNGNEAVEGIAAFVEKRKPNFRKNNGSNLYSGLKENG